MTRILITVALMCSANLCQAEDRPEIKLEGDLKPQLCTEKPSDSDLKVGDKAVLLEANAQPLKAKSYLPSVKTVSAGLLDVVPIEDEGSGIGFEITADYFGKYIWRGQNISDDPVFQPGATLTAGGFTAAFWGNLETTNINGQNDEFTEFDWSLDYSGDVPFIDGVGFSVGVINYQFPSFDETTEVYCGVGLDLPLSPSATVYFDVDDVKGTYASFGLSHSVEKIAELGSDVPVGMDVSASLGWGSASYNKAYWGTVRSAKLNDLALSVSFPFELGGWTLAPSLNYVTLVNGSVRKSNAFRSESDYFFVGISAVKPF